MKVTDEMVDRFLAWRLPKDFGPDCGITFKPINHPDALTHLWPIGTNLLTAVQARQMLEHVLGGTVSSARATEDARITELREWLARNPYFEDGRSVEVSYGALKALLASVPSAMRAICPENMQPCKEGCVDGWCQTMFGHPNG